MKALFINGSPRKNWNTHKILQSAIQGAQTAGADTELIHLYDLNYKGCVSCFACKLKNAKTHGLCAYHDALTPVLEKALNSDVVVIGSPVYFSYATGMVRTFMERLLFPIGSYSVDKNGERLRAIDKVIYSAMIYTMNCPEEFAKQIHYPEILETSSNVMNITLGYCETLYAYDTYQFNDYSRYEANMFNENDKARQRSEQFPKDLENAYELGKRLVEKASQ